MIASMQKTSNGTITLTVTIPLDAVKKAWESIIDEAVKNAEIKGFRIGKAPRNLVEDKLDKNKIREEVLKKILPSSYAQAIKTHSISPIINPKIHVDKIDDLSTSSSLSLGVEDLRESNGWQFTALTCEAPVVKLENYKDAIKKVTAKSKIIIPGKEPQAPKFEDIVKTLLENTNVAIPEILVDSETDRLLSQTLDEVKKLGLTLDQYLASTGRNPQSLREEYKKKAENDIRLEFALQKISDEEKITVEEKEINEAILKAKNDIERKNLESNRYLLASILKQQKTLDFLKNL